MYREKARQELEQEKQKRVLSFVKATLEEIEGFKNHIDRINRDIAANEIALDKIDRNDPKAIEYAAKQHESNKIGSYIPPIVTQEEIDKYLSG